MLDTPFSFCFFSTLHAKASIAPHTAPCNLRLRFHLPLVVPTKSASSSEGGSESEGEGSGEGGEEGTPACGMRIAGSLASWEEGRALVFDDSYEHEVWNQTDDDRIVLLWDGNDPTPLTSSRHLPLPAALVITCLPTYYHHQPRPWR